MNGKSPDRPNTSANARQTDRSSTPQPNPAVTELQAVRTELEGVRNELIGLRADLKGKKTFGITDRVAKGILLAGFTAWLVVTVLNALVQSVQPSPLTLKLQQFADEAESAAKGGDGSAQRSGQK